MYKNIHRQFNKMRIILHRQIIIANYDVQKHTSTIQ